MVATFCLFTCALLMGQPADASEWLLAPRLGRGQELVYSGTFREEVLGQGSQFVRSYQLQTNVFVMGQGQRGLSAALLTVLQMQALRPDKDQSLPRSVRLELANVDPQGRVTGPAGKPFLVPVEGPPSIETGAFVEFPLGRVGPRQGWDAAEPGRPDRVWHIVGAETVNNLRCLKLVGEQQSEDWEQPRADRCAWRRLDTVWVAPSQGVACRVQRVIERKEPARNHVSQRSVLRYELVSRMTYPGRLFEDRRNVIMQARRFADQAAPFLHQPGLYEAQIDALLKRIGDYLEYQPAIEPYTRAVQAVQHRLLAAKRGEVAPEPLPEEAAPLRPSRAALGQPAPDFVATDFVHKNSVRLQRLRGQPVLLIFYNPSSPLAKEVLLFGAAQQRLGAAVVGLMVAGDEEAARKQYAELRLTYPVAAGAAFKKSFGVDATPRLMVIDARGVVRGAYTGWGSETPREVSGELQRWQRH